MPWKFWGSYSIFLHHRRLKDSYHPSLKGPRALGLLLAQLEHVWSKPEAWQYFINTALGNGTFVQWLKTDLSLEPQWHTGLIHSKLPT